MDANNDDIFSQRILTLASFLTTNVRGLIIFGTKYYLCTSLLWDNVFITFFSIFSQKAINYFTFNGNF